MSQFKNILTQFEFIRWILGLVRRWAAARGLLRPHSCSHRARNRFWEVRLTRFLLSRHDLHAAGVEPGLATLLALGPVAGTIRAPEEVPSAVG